MDSTVTLERTLTFTRRGSQFLVSLIKNEEKKDKEEKRSCHECKCDLVDYHSLPEFSKQDKFDVNYYRSEWPLKQTILSIFSIHNEIHNIWTHLIRFFIFLALATTMMTSIGTHTQATKSLSSISDTSVPLKLHHELLVLPSFQPNVIAASTNKSEPETLQQIPRWPFYAYLSGAMFCLLVSSACHLLSCHSEHTCYFMLRLDYEGVSALIITSFYPLVCYTFICEPFFRILCMGFNSLRHGQHLRLAGACIRET